jgi:hypothetical protein
VLEDLGRRVLGCIQYFWPGWGKRELHSRRGFEHSGELSGLGRFYSNPVNVAEWILFDAFR